MRTRRWSKVVLATAALGALLTFSATGVASGSSSEGDSSSCKGNEQQSSSVRKAKTKTSMPKPAASCPEIEVTKQAEKDEYKQGEAITWTVKIKNTGDSDVTVKVEDEGVKLYGPGAKAQTSKKAKTKSSSCEGYEQSSKKAKSSKKNKKSEDCDKREKCDGLIKAGATLECIGYQKVEKCGEVKNTVKVTARNAKTDDKDDKDKKDKKYSKSSDSSGKVVVKASDTAWVRCDPKVSKSAKLSYTKTWNWDIAKSADQTKVESTGTEATVKYIVKVTKSGPTNSNITVTGEIDVFNPYYSDASVKVKDELLYATCLVDGVAEKSATIGYGKTSFPYVCTLTDLPAEGVKNKATVTLTVGEHVSTGTTEEPIKPGYVAEVDNAVKVTDMVWKLGTPNNTVFIAEEVLGANVTETTEFKYSRTFPVPATNCVSYKNIATVSGVGMPNSYPPKDEHEGTTTEDGNSTSSESTGSTENTTSTDGGYQAAGGAGYGTTTSYGSTESTGSTTEHETTGTTTNEYPSPPATSTLPKSDDWTVEICRKVQDLAVTKTAITKVTNKWTIDKTLKTSGTNVTNVADDSWTISPASSPQSLNYGVSLTKTPTYTVSGKVSVTNPNPFAVSAVTVTDTIPGATCVVTGGNIGTLAAGASGEATYICTGLTGGTGTNTAPVSWTDPANVVHNQNATAGYNFAAANVVEADSANVTDVFDGQAGTPQATGVTASGPITDYQKSALMTGPGIILDANGCRNVVNTATVTASDGSTDSDTVTVKLCLAPGTFGAVKGTTTTTTTTTAGTPANRAALRLDKSGPGAATAGQVVTYRIKVTNRSKLMARNVVVRDLLPSGFSVSGKLKGAGISKGAISWKVGNLAPGKSKTVAVKMRIDASVGGRRCNRAVATASNAVTMRDTQCTRIAAVAGAVEPGVTG